MICLCFAGKVDPGGGNPANVEEYNGSTWSEVTDQPQALQNPGGTGTQTCSSGRVFEGEFNQDKSDINWKELPPLTKPRCFHKAVKMKNRLYIFGGLKVENGGSREILDSYEYFDFNKQEWTSNKYDFAPFSLAHLSIVVNEDETYALLIKGYEDKDENKTSCKCKFEDFCICDGMPLTMFIRH